ncbi:6-phosphofructokinase subunit beta [Sugiyamaella lignohabitans]|uniref:ATP-dependent 6-phosphofructokinase n=1 Tax=Sugiyamaella lignohabitans TaxID=796027 RepID=A0A167DNJ0_9ASCO|nr:6-phosphofructokinase subunit beta [Sugiyamaella lignohabitans]ANB13106.1 6-phosphofructokinase subunit beta [Sugiyamaella lignohabitans]
MSGSIEGVSFLSLVTSDEKLFKDTLAFYKKLGFTIFQEYRHNAPVATAGIQSITSHAQASISEEWLTSIPINPNNNEDQVDKSLGVTLKIRLIASGPCAEDVDAKIKSFMRHGEDGDWRGDGPSFVLYSSNILEVSKILKDSGAGHIVQSHPTEVSPVELYGIDPLGNIIGFTRRCNPFTIAVDPIKRVHQDEFIGEKGANAASAPGSDSGEGPKKRIAVMTSGGDAPGMNSAVRAVIRTAIHRGCEAYAVYEGYEGLVRGGDYIREMTWGDVRGYLSIGGTSIGTARCARFREREGRLEAAKNMIEAGIDGLIVCGGDGSLTGADLFRAEWPSLIAELAEKGHITKELAEEHKHLYICGLVGSIDNDMSSTDATIGAYSSLDRICEMVDYIDATAQSHSRAFVIEVMGRHCGWLALMAGIATGADYVFIPEKPPKKEGWSDQMVSIVKRHRERGMRKTIVIVAEGAIDNELRPITPEMVKDVLVDLGLDTRITTLGHVQRGGTAVAFDRLLGTLQGVDAVDAILSATPETPSPMIGIIENKIVRRNLVEAVALTKSVAEAIEAKDFTKAMNLRDSEFCEHLDNFMLLTSADTVPKHPAEHPLNIAIINIGAPAGGMNAALRAAAAYCFSRGHKPYAIHNGWTGLARHESVREINWLEVEQWAIQGGSEIGTNRNLPEVDLGMIAYYFQKYSFDGLIIIGGFEAYHSLHQLEQARFAYPAFRIPMVCLPATISNNVPGTEYSLGTDTCLNALVTYCDVVKQSASATRHRAFVVEVQGGNSGYVAAYAGLVTGAHIIYTPEEGISFSQLGADIEFLKKCYKEDQGRNRAGRLIVRNEKASKIFTTQMLVDIIHEEAKGAFEAREAVPGHVQQGGVPSPMDRIRATRLGVQCVHFLENNQKLRSSPTAEATDMFSVIGIRSSKLVFTPVSILWETETEIKTRRPNKVFWSGLLRTAEMMNGRPRIDSSN